MTWWSRLLAWHFGIKVALSERPAIAKAIIEHAYLGHDPMKTVPLLPFRVPEGSTHVTAQDVDAAVALAPTPLTFWVEVGSFQGGSAAVTAGRLKEHHRLPNVTVLCVDTFLGDFATMWSQPAEHKRNMVGDDGLPKILRQFVSHVTASGHADIVLPLLGTSTAVLRALRRLHTSGLLTDHPQVIYLDSSHERDETFLELELAWAALAPGGVMFGDDWEYWIPEDPDEPGDRRYAPVQQDLLRWTALREQELDDNLGASVSRTLGRVRHGLYVTYQTFQWFVRKPVSWRRGALPRAAAAALVEARATPSSAKATKWDCFSGGFTHEYCCDAEKAREGDTSCWDIMYTYEKCC